MVGGQQSRRTASPRSEHEHPKTKLLPKLEIHSDEAGPQDALGGTRREEYERSALVDSRALPVEASSSATEKNTCRPLQPGGGHDDDGIITTGAAVVASIAALAVPFRRRKVRWMKITPFDRQAGTRMGRERQLKGSFDRRTDAPTHRPTDQLTSNLYITRSSFACYPSPPPPPPIARRSWGQSHKPAMNFVPALCREDCTSCLSCCWSSLPPCE